jgi:hypothetical protein
MHKLIDYVCSELDGLERKAEKSGLTMSEVQYMDTLAHAKKNLLTGEAMMDRGESGYYMPMYGRSYGDHDMEGDSYARRRDNMGRYTSRRGGMSYGDDGVEELRTLMEKAPNEAIKREYRKLIEKIENM